MQVLRLLSEVACMDDWEMLILEMLRSWTNSVLYKEELVEVVWSCQEDGWGKEALARFYSWQLENERPVGSPYKRQKDGVGNAVTTRGRMMDNNEVIQMYQEGGIRSTFAMAAADGLCPNWHIVRMWATNLSSLLRNHLTRGGGYHQLSIQPWSMTFTNPGTQLPNMFCHILSLT